jgi:uncharacterized protein YkwD
VRPLVNRGLVFLSAVLACAVLAVVAPAGAAAGCRGADVRPGQTSNSRLAAATRCLVNVERRRRGLRRLRDNRRLALAARRHARDMAVHNFFSHASFTGESSLDRIRRTGYLRGARRWTVGENIAWGQDASGTPREIVRAWMRSPGHRANILDRAFRQFGLAVELGAPAGYSAGAFFVNDFGARR